MAYVTRHELLGLFNVRQPAPLPLQKNGKELGAPVSDQSLASDEVSLENLSDSSSCYGNMNYDSEDRPSQDHNSGT